MPASFNLFEHDGPIERRVYSVSMEDSLLGPYEVLALNVSSVAVNLFFVSKESLRKLAYDILQATGTTEDKQ